MIKTLYLVNTDTNGKLISHSVHSDELCSSFKSKQMQIKNISINELMEKNLDNLEEGIFLIHSFKEWTESLWNALTNNIRVPLFTVPTEYTDDYELIRNTFSRKSVSRVIVGSECYQKHFTKALQKNGNKVKLIHSSGSDSLLEIENYQQTIINPKIPPIIVVPGLIDNEKNIESLLMAMSKIHLKHRNAIILFNLKSKDSTDTKSENLILDNLCLMSEQLKIRENVRFYINGPQEYQWYMKIADMILIPQQKNQNMYSGTLIDAVIAGKAIVAPDTKMAFDLCKKDAGIYLYETNATITVKIDKKLKTSVTRKLSLDEMAESIAENCNIILDNSDLKSIMQEQNTLLSKNYLQSKISQQYLNLIRRYKS
jgi:glycosyltransferase involved in cell wall biosynthesis